MVRRWCRQFSEGRQSVHDEERSARPSLFNDDRVELVRQCIMENHRFTITELSSHFPQISRSLLHEIVTKHLLFKKVCARIVTGDETWISHFTPETKQQSMHWRHSGSPVRTKFIQTLSVQKVMCMVFWDRKGILLIDFLPRGETVNADRYCETLRKLRRAIQNKRRGMLTASVVLLHDNARPHTARRTAAALTEFCWELFDHPPYSPHLAPSDFHVFLHLKKFLSSGGRVLQQRDTKIREVEGKLQQETPRCASPVPPQCPGGSPASNMAVVPQDDMPVCKIAERVVLRKMDNNRQITGSQLATYGVCNTVLAESLVSELQEADLQELSRSEAVRKQYEVETERLTSRLEHARAQNAVLALTLDESKTQCDRLSLLVGKYESNATALRLALGYSDRAIEAYDVLVALLESELGLLLANCRAAGIGNPNNTKDNDGSGDGDSDCAGDVAALLRRAGENRRAAETVARHLLARLDNATTTGGMGPWDDYSHTTSTSSSSDCCSEWGQGEERRLRDHIGKLKTERSSVRATVVELESCHVEPLVARQPISLAEARKLDLETAVLMQELMAMREDKAELRARVYLLEKERSALELKLSSQEAHQAAQQATVQHLQAQLQDAERRLQAQHQQELGCEGEDDESELADALRREARLKERLQELVTTLEKVGKNSELRHQQSADLVNDLKRANSALVQTLERSKKKYQSRLKKLEQQMLGMVERHSAQVKTNHIFVKLS
ncbi:hypothetical protein ANN_03016, partial [Periplaneta americana]